MEVSPQISVRELEAGDRPAWARLWGIYLEHYGETLPAAVTESTWRRLTGGPDERDPRMGGLVAFDGATLVGLAHYVTAPSTWSRHEEAYLSDLVVAPEARGRGAGRALIEALVLRGRASSWRRLHWITQEDNATARRLYDAVATFNGFIQYELELATDEP